jgi:hypothetical protein
MIVALCLSSDSAPDCSPRMQGKAGSQAMTNMMADVVSRGLVNNLAIHKKLGGASGTVSNEQLHRNANAQVPQESVTSMSTKLTCVRLTLLHHNSACRSLTSCACATGRASTDHAQCPGCLLYTHNDGVARSGERSDGSQAARWQALF